MVQKKIIPKNLAKLRVLNYIKHFLKHGKGHTAQDIWLEALRTIRKEKKRPVSKIVTIALASIAPFLDEKKIKRGKEIYFIPSPIKWNRSRRIAFKWLISEQKGNIPSKKLSQTILGMTSQQSKLADKTKQWHEKIQRNANFLRYRWY